MGAKTEYKNNRGYAWVVVGVMCLAWMCAGFGLSMVIPWIPFYIVDWELNFVQAGLILVITAVPLMFVGPLTKWMSTKLGKDYAKKIVVISLALMTLAALGSAFAPEFYTLIIARFIMGIGVFSIFLVGVMTVIPWFGMQNMKTLLPRFSVVSIACLTIGFMIVLMALSSINSLTSFNYDLTQAYFFVPLFGITTLLALGLIKEVKQ